MARQQSAYTLKEERLLRELGLSIAAQWHRMPVEVKTIILNQAETSMGREQAREALQELHVFLENYTPHSLDADLE